MNATKSSTLRFQSTFPRGERLIYTIRITLLVNFNPRSRVGNDCPNCGKHFIGTDFNPRSRVGNDAIPPLSVHFHCISIHVPAWGTTIPAGVCSSMSLFQSTFPRGERLLSTFQKYRRYYISIHVPAWGTTRNLRLQRDRGEISIHVPAWGTTDTNCQNSAKNEFQSTFPRGERQRPETREHRQRPISIHVPAWGTTNMTGGIVKNMLFQSTFPRGERHICVAGM